MVNSTFAAFCGTKKPDNGRKIIIKRVEKGQILWTDELVQCVKHQLSLGKSYAQVADYLGVTYSSVQKYCKRNGMKSGRSA